MAGAGSHALLAALVAGAIALFPAAASAQPFRVAMLPADRYGELAATDDEPVANVVGSLPRGRVDVVPTGVVWRGRRPAGIPRGCAPAALASGEALTGPVRFRRGDVKPGSTRRGKTSALVIGGGPTTPRRVSADTFTARSNAPRALIGSVHVHLPDDVLPAYPRRDLYLVAIEASFDLPDNCPDRVRRIGERAVRAMLGRIRIELPPNYTPPSDQAPPTTDLAGAAGLQLRGVHASTEAGVRVAPAGDVNGDGLQDALVAAPHGGKAGERPGAIYVVFGRPGGGIASLDDLGPTGFRIDGPGTNTWFLTAAAVGDMDGDGLADIAVGAPETDGGTVYVVRGKRDGGSLDLAKQQNVLFRIGGVRRCGAPQGSESIGESVASAGDANGDGIGDVALVAGGKCGDGTPTGGVYVVFGKRTAGDVDLRRLGSAGITATGTDVSSSALAGVGDVNGDGLADVLVGGIGYEMPSYAALIPGRRDGGAVDLAHTETRITGGYCSGIGGAVAAAGDVNADGLADIAIGAPDGCADNRERAYVVFGRRDFGRVDLDTLGSGGYEIVGSATFHPGSSLASAGDVNGDGLPDLALGDPRYSPAGRREAGAVVLVYGKQNSEQVRLRTLGAGGRRWLGAERESALGFSLAGLGDFDGDGRPDLLAGMPHRADYAGGAWLLPAP
jgi:hypothetical protein